jgi:hypothetical protein
MLNSTRRSLRYGVTDRDDVRYIYSALLIVERAEKAAYEGRNRSCELCLASKVQWRGEPELTAAAE